MPPRIIDEYTYRDDLDRHQKWRLRHPEKRRQIKNTSDRRNWADKTPEERRDHHLRRRYKITFDDFKKMVEEQDGKCLTCSKDLVLIPDKLGHDAACVDHCHETGKVRGILCNNCNRAIGLVKEDIEVLRNMINYLTEAGRV